MAPKEKAKDLVDKMKSSLFSDGEYDAKQCALIAVDEIIEVVEDCKTDYFENYWQEVKQEINNL